jgi:type VI secretion system protein ImpA
MRFESAIQSPDDYLQHYLGYTLSGLMAPIGENDVGESVRHNGVYFNIKNARASDDASLPMGVWTHDLKTADWHEVKQLALTALAEKSKDLQLGVWLFEANIHLDGFVGVAPSAFLIKALCQEYWPNMHPEMVDSDIEYRTNPLSWINDKLTPVLKLIPITSAQLDGDEYCWNDWISAQHYEKLKSQQQLPKQWDGVTPQIFKQRLAATPSDNLMALYWVNEDGLQAMEELQSWLDQCCGNDSPNLTDITSILSSINEMLSTELQRRGADFSLDVMADSAPLSMAGANENDDSDSTNDNSSGHQGNDAPGGAGGGGNFSGNGQIRDRTDAFICLRKAAEFLMNDDPHSPVPYLVQTACDWGDKSAPDLYQELFLTKGGQLNIFELMGLDVDKT